MPYRKPAPYTHGNEAVEIAEALTLAIRTRMKRGELDYIEKVSRRRENILITLKPGEVVSVATTERLGLTFERTEYAGPYLGTARCIRWHTCDQRRATP